MASKRQNGSLTQSPQTDFAVRQGVPPAPPPSVECLPLCNPHAKGATPLTPPTVRRLDAWRRGLCHPAPRLAGILPQVKAKTQRGFLHQLAHHG